MPQFRVRTLLVTTAVVALGIACWQMQTVPFLPTIAHYPFDILRGHEMRRSTQVGIYKVSLVQRPGSDFYETFFEISTDSRSRVSKLMIRPDDSKWRDPHILTRDGRIYFCDGSTISGTTPYVDLDTMTIHYQLVRNQETVVKFDTLTFNGNWK